MCEQEKNRIRIFRREDQDAVLSLQEEFIEEFFPELLDDPRLHEWNSDVHDIYSSYIESSGIFWVIEKGAQVIGMGGIKINEGSPIISRVRVKKTERSQGLGTLLLKHMEDYCFKKGYKKILVDTENHMISAVKFYEGHNYRRIRESTEKIDGKIYITYFYEKNL